MITIQHKELQLAPEAAANRLQVTVRTLYNMAERGQIEKLPLNSGRVVFRIPSSVLDTYDDTVTMKGACSILNRSRGTLYRYIAMGLITPVSQDSKSRVRFSRSSIERFNSWLNSVSGYAGGEA